MRINSRVYDEKQDMFEGIRVPNCPSEFRVIAENILMMASKPGYAVGDYNTMTELDKNLMVDYWHEYDGMKALLYTMFPHTANGFKPWFIKHATAPELIRRARQWLTERNYLIVKTDVQKRALEAGSKYGRSIKAGG